MKSLMHTATREMKRMNAQYLASEAKSYEVLKEST